MIHLHQHIPSFVEGVEGRVADAARLAELFEVPWVKDYARDIEPIERRGKVTGWVDGKERTVDVIYRAPEEKRFYRWSRADDHLMAEHNNGDYYWVVGHITADDPRELADLPPWVITPAGQKRIDEWNAGGWGKKQVPAYRCAEHGVWDVTCCLPVRGVRVSS